MQIFFQKNLVISKICFCSCVNNWKLSATLGYSKAPITGIPQHGSRLLYVSITASALCQASFLHTGSSLGTKIRCSQGLSLWWWTGEAITPIFAVCHFHFLPCCHLLYLQAFAMILHKVLTQAKSFRFIHILTCSLLKSSILILVPEL